MEALSSNTDENRACNQQHGSAGRQDDSPVQARGPSSWRSIELVVHSYNYIVCILTCKLSYLVTMYTLHYLRYVTYDVLFMIQYLSRYSTIPYRIVSYHAVSYMFIVLISLTYSTCACGPTAYVLIHMFRTHSILYITYVSSM